MNNRLNKACKEHVFTIQLLRPQASLFAWGFCVSIKNQHRTSLTMKKSTVSIEQYRRMIAMQAWQAWKKLPLQTRIWIDVSDMIEDGMMQAWKLTQTYNPRWASFTTALYHRLHKFFINEYLEYHSAYKRGWTEIQAGDKVVKTNKRYGHKRALEFQSMEALMSTKAAKDENMSFDESGVFWPLVVSPEPIIDNVVTECFVVPTLEKIYKEASPRLQNKIYEWFLTTDASRIHTKGKPFRRAAKEFRELCQHENITCSDCLHLVRSPSCLDTLSRQLFDIPYNLEYPCPAAERVL